MERISFLFDSNTNSPGQKVRALVTGASAGIGRSFAVTLAARGYSVTAVARGTEALEALIAELGDGHDHLGGYTLLVNNAGTAGHGDFAGVPLESALTTLDLNYRSIVVLAHAFSAGPHPVVLCRNRYREHGYRLPCH